MTLVRRLIALLLVVLVRPPRRSEPAPAQPDTNHFEQTGLNEPGDIGDVISADLPRDRRAELAVAVALWVSVALFVAFIVAYVASNNTQLLGLTLGAGFLALGVGLVITGKAVVAQDKLVERRPDLEPDAEADDVADIIERGGAGITRKRLLSVSAGAAGAALGAALITPAASLGPWIGEQSIPSPWRRGVRLVDENGAPIKADSLIDGSFATAFAEGADPELLASSLIVIRIDPASIAVRQSWSPDGIIAFSKICTHAGCAVAMMRYPLFNADAPGPALVCPCHYSTFDVTHGARVIFGPAGRPLPQLPLKIDEAGRLVADGPLSGDVGPSWNGINRGSA